MIQDPVWEQSYPDVGGLVVPFEPPDGTAGGGLVRLSTAEADRRREENEERRRDLLHTAAGARPRAGARLVARAPRRPLLVPDLGRPAAVHAGAGVKALLLVLAAASARTARRLLRTTANRPRRRPAGSLATSRSLTPTAHLFGDFVQARRRRDRRPGRPRSRPRRGEPGLPPLPDPERGRRARARTSRTSPGCAGRRRSGASRSRACPAGSRASSAGRRGAASGGPTASSRPASPTRIRRRAR